MNNKYNSAIKVLMIVFTIAFIIGIMAIIGLLTVGEIGWGTAISSFLTGVINLILIYALNNALARISTLEDKMNKVDKPMQEHEKDLP